MSAVTVVISVLASNLKKVLSYLAGCLGNGLKDVGEKLEQILPGLDEDDDRDYNNKNSSNQSFSVSTFD